MPLNWTDVSKYSFKALLLLERVQIGWLSIYPGIPKAELAAALRANPAVEWYLRHKNPQINPWLDEVMQHAGKFKGKRREAEIAVLRSIEDWIVYALDPHIYDAQPFLGWDSSELTSMIDFNHKIVLDIGSGTGRLALTAAQTGARLVCAVEPVENLRHYLVQKAFKMGLSNVYAVEGLITSIPFPDGYADVTMGGHVFGDDPRGEFEEMKRVTRRGGMILLCPGTSENEQTAHQFLVSQGFGWSEFEEPQDGTKRKYWLTVN
jgi:SAM-dependent methyltransferase